MTVCLKSALETACWNIITHLAIWGSIGLWFLFLLIYARMWPVLPFGADMADLDAAIFSSWLFWLALLVIPFFAILVDIVVKLIMRTCFKSLADKIIELELARASQSQVPNETMREQARAMVLNLISTSHQAAGGGGGGGGAGSSSGQKTISPAGADGLSSMSPTTSTNISPGAEAQIDAAHGYSFSQVEGGGQLSQANMIRMYRTKLKKPRNSPASLK